MHLLEGGCARNIAKTPPIYRGLMPVIPLSVLMDLISYWQTNHMMSRSGLKELISYWEKHNMIQFTKSTLMTGSFPISSHSIGRMVQFTTVTLMTKSGEKTFVIAVVKDD
jgi:hypothetical protein